MGGGSGNKGFLLIQATEIFLCDSDCYRFSCNLLQGPKWCHLSLSLSLRHLSNLFSSLLVYFSTRLSPSECKMPDLYRPHSIWGESISFLVAVSIPDWPFLDPTQVPASMVVSKRIGCSDQFAAVTCSFHWLRRQVGWGRKFCKGKKNLCNQKKEKSNWARQI